MPCDGHCVRMRIDVGHPSPSQSMAALPIQTLPQDVLDIGYPEYQDRLKTTLAGMKKEPEDGANADDQEGDVKATDKDIEAAAVVNNPDLHTNIFRKLAKGIALPVEELESMVLFSELTMTVNKLKVAASQESMDEIVDMVEQQKRLQGQFLKDLRTAVKDLARPCVGPGLAFGFKRVTNHVCSCSYSAISMHRLN